MVLREKAMTRRQFFLAALCSVLLVGGLMIASWITTHERWCGHYRIGEWKLVIEDRYGNPIEGATITLLWEGGEETRLPVFDGYRGPGSIVSSIDGEIHLKNSRSVGVGGSHWDVLWIWRVGWDVKPLYVRISAEGYEAITMSYQALVEGSIPTRVILPEE